MSDDKIFEICKKSAATVHLGSILKICIDTAARRSLEGQIEANKLFEEAIAKAMALSLKEILKK